MYSDIIPPKKNKNKLDKIKAAPEVVRVLKDEPIITTREVYHTMDGKDKKSNLPTILIVIALLILSIVYYSVFNNNTRISFESKSTIFEIKDNIPMILSEKNQTASTTLSYNLIYNNEVKDRNIFAPIYEESTTTVANTAVQKDVEYFNLNTSTTSPFTSKKVSLINKSNANVPLRKDTRFDVNGVTYYLGSAVNIKPMPKNSSSTDQVKYRVIGFKGTSDYENFYAVDYIDTNQVALDNSTTSADVKTITGPNEDILSLIPENFISLKKSYVYDNSINQSALVVIDKKDFEKVLLANSKILQDYIEYLKPIGDLLEYEISINDYELQLDTTTGLPVSFKNLIIEIKPIVVKDKVASVFKGFSKDRMKKIKNDISKHINMEISYSPFWMTNVSDEDHINVEVK
jgi:hypothetical protein